MTMIPETQCAVQLVGPDQLRINEAKPVFQPGPHQVLCRVEVCGLCFSDLKLLKQFSSHARKSEVVAGIAPDVLAQMPQYVPGEKPVVPGHETVVRVVKVGPEVERFKVGERYLVQTDFRWLPTRNSNSAFGYNFEGALQEYVLVDERVITAPDGETMFIPAPEDLSASAIALCEPWACVEDAYVEKQRRGFKRDGKTLIVADHEPKVDGAGKITYAGPSALSAGKFDDVIYFGGDAAVCEKLFANVGTNGLFVIVQGGKKFGRPVVTAVGRVHYGGIRVVGTAGSNVADALAAIPATAEIRPNDKINIVGAAGPMGTMHVLRDLCQGVPGVTVCAGDLNDERLAALKRLAEPLAQKNRLALRPYNPSKDKPAERFNYIVLMAPVPALVAQAVRDAAPRAIINIFAGIPADKTGEIDLDAYLEKQCYFIGTSGSTLDDMKVVLKKVASRQLDTNLSVAAITGLDGAVDGIRAVEKNLMPGKIIVYPFAKGLRLTALPEVGKEHAGVARALHDGQWSRNAEEALKREFEAP
ncbi:MAG: alcohol dehydrogenase catalytic domain-containing protein [Verrucomicrobiota bacterium]|nr:alcohol dehydrogenase catalytic domain-containing protein [Verrucomicrobiota bacterium]MDE3066815.1 alcohol dehydrogenase catalytic domain-containing protein [Verrucomicrobiota bacterium]